MNETLKQPELPGLIYKCAEEMEGYFEEFNDWEIDNEGETEKLFFSVKEGYEGYIENSETEVSEKIC